MTKAHAYSEAELVAGCQAGKPVFQRALYERYHRLMFGVCLRYTDNRDDAHDIMQEGFIRVFSNIHKFRSQGSFEGWVRRIMVHTSIEHYRKNSRYFMVDIEEARGIEFDADALTSLSRQEILHLVQQLPPGYRTVFNLYAIEGHSHQEVALMLDISVGTSKSQLSRAKKQLQTQLERMNRRAVGN
ncbi:MAG: RNA polymerase sigma factor [Bacteroidota bacterium]